MLHFVQTNIIPYVPATGECLGLPLEQEASIISMSWSTKGSQLEGNADRS